MTYLQFLVVFQLVPLAILAVPVARALRQRPSNGAGLAALVVAAYVWTTPWDNYLVATGVWEYGPQRVIGTLWYVPVEEYAFFGLQTLLVGGVVLLALRRTGELAPSPPTARARLTTVMGWLAVAAAAAALTLVEPLRYLGLIVSWLAVPMAAQWWYGGRWLAQRLRAVWVPVAAVIAYLWLADAYAIADGIWTISDRFTTGIAVGPLPLEEAVFFAGTTLLVVQGLILFTSVRQEAPAWNR